MVCHLLPFAKIGQIDAHWAIVHYLPKALQMYINGAREHVPEETNLSQLTPLVLYL